MELAKWSESQPDTIPGTLPTDVVAATGGFSDLSASRTAVYAIISSRLGKNMKTMKKRACGDGLELWRILLWEYRGASEEAMAVKRDR